MNHTFLGALVIFGVENFCLCLCLLSLPEILLKGEIEQLLLLGCIYSRSLD